jgi:hypothetical protein
MTVIASLGIERSIFLRLCSLAPFILIKFCIRKSFNITEWGGRS